MKHTFLLLISLITFHNIPAMDQEKKEELPIIKTSKDFTPLDIKADRIIQEMNNVDRSIGWSHNPKTLLKITSCIPQCYPHLPITPTLIKHLKKNDRIIFKATLSSFIKYAEENASKVAMDNLETIADYRKPQPVKILNELPLGLKKYCMENIPFTTCIARKITAKAPIYKIDIHLEKNLIVTAAIHDAFTLWDLAKETEIWRLPQQCQYGTPRFNKDATLLATASTSSRNSECTIIKIWNLSKNLEQYTIEHYGQAPIEDIYFLDSSNNPQLEVIELDEEDPTLKSQKKYIYNLTTNRIVGPSNTVTETKAIGSYLLSCKNCTAIFNAETITIQIKSLLFQLFLDVIQKTKNPSALYEMETMTAFYKLNAVEKDEVLKEKSKRQYPQQLTQQSALDFLTNIFS